jgi:hypothetical protein
MGLISLQPQLQTTFDDTFGEAIQQLVTWGGIITGEDAKYVSPCLTLVPYSRSIGAQDILRIRRLTLIGLVRSRSRAERPGKNGE